MAIIKPNDLYLYLQGQLVEEDMNVFKYLVRNNPINPADLEKCKTFMAVCQQLEDMKKIIPAENNFENLKDLLSRMNKNQLVDVIIKYQAEQAEKERMRPRQAVQPQQRPQQVVQPQQAAVTSQETIDHASLGQPACTYTETAVGEATTTCNTTSRSAHQGVQPKPITFSCHQDTKVSIETQAKKLKLSMSVTGLSEESAKAPLKDAAKENKLVDLEYEVLQAKLTAQQEKTVTQKLLQTEVTLRIEKLNSEGGT